MTPKHIAVDARIINSSTGRYIERLLTYLEQLDSPHQFSVLVRSKDIDYWQPTKPNFKLVVADFHQYTMEEQVGFYLFLKRFGADLVHFCMPQQPLLYTGAAVTTVHDLNLLRINENESMSWPVLKFKQAIFKNLLRTVIRRSRYIITPTQYVKDDLRKFQKVTDNNVIVTHEAADLVSDTEDIVTEFVNKKFLLVVGRAEKYKNQKGAIQAHQLLLEKHPDLYLVIVGKRDETSRELERWVKCEGYRQVSFFGFASDEQLAWFYSHCAAYIFPSFMEGFGLPPLEAMRHGAPVASSNTTCMPEVLGDAALYFNPAQPHEIAQQTNRILDEKILRDQLITKGLERTKQYSWQRMAEQTLNIYNDALSS